MKHSNLFQTKLQDKIPVKGLNETEITNLFDKDFKVPVISMLMDLQKNTQDLRENLNKMIEDLPAKDLHRVKNTESEMKHTIGRFNSRHPQVENCK